MIKKNIVLVILMLTALNLSAQYFIPKQKNVLKLEGRHIIVRLEEPNYKVLRKYKKDPQKAEEYKAKIEKRNDLFKECIAKYWKLKNDLSYEVGLTADDKAHADKNNTAILCAELGTETRLGAKVRRDFSCYRIALMLPESKVPLFRVSFPSEDLTEVDYKFAFKQFDKYIKASLAGMKTMELWDIEGNLRLLADNKLIIKKSNTELTIDEVREAYPNKIDFAKEGESLDDIILKGSDDTLFLTYIWSEITQSYMFTVVKASTMDVVALLGTGQKSVSFGIPLGNRLVNLYSFRSELTLEKKHFEYLASRKAMERNNKCSSRL